MLLITIFIALAATAVSALPPTRTQAEQVAPAAPTLVPGYGFIRSVQSPTFHKYLRSAVSETVSKAVLGEADTAALFNITGGHLLQRTSTGTLYGVVEDPVDSNADKLQLSWAETPPSGGFFVWAGDSLLWNNPSVPRPQTNAWLVCPDSSSGSLDVYVNLGPYGYMTPAGCTDSTIHDYTGPSAVP